MIIEPLHRIRNLPRAIFSAGRILGTMGVKLSLSNRYLRNPKLREKMVTNSVATSSAIEGIRAPFRRDASSETSRKKVLIRKKS